MESLAQSFTVGSRLKANVQTVKITGQTAQNVQSYLISPLSHMGTSLVFAMLLVVSTRCDEGQPEVDLFHQADANNDDKLTRIELNTVFLLFDIDNDTKISPTEFVKDWVDVYHLGGGTEAQILFTRADGNDDGYLDAKDVPTVFTYFDMNDDGFIDISEFLTQWGDLKLHPVGQIAVSVDITG